MRLNPTPERRHTQNADHLAHKPPFSAFFTEVVCDLGATPPQVAASSPPIGGICNIRDATRRRHADSQLLMLQNPHRHQCRARCKGRGPGWGAGGCRKPGNCTHGRRHGETNFAHQEPRRAASVQNSPSTSRTALLPVQNSPCSPEMARFGAFSACRESFVPFSPPRSQAGRILYRTRGRVGASHDSTPSPTSAEGTGGRRRNRRFQTAWPRRPQPVEGRE